ncbi:MULTISPECIES: LuxR C-terminal-related transcriptional regulator [unclassified Nocardioides]|uniref:LuxR C-terminal-related transcriptional regulator n=1 Tax=unclassified Nocardioides TaxID=2615069 RepID=UPI0006F612DE|nr:MULTISPECIES: LuxR C-terminal-related transcriptional regulator [unclassified Nocardioides]KQY50859.1 hypothetical protein ASD30_20385 [Nocardioides sp. Root140]KRF14719.1 hypothetical protein ASH02_10525 [Nocardioides sp. Soil796]
MFDELAERVHAVLRLTSGLTAEPGLAAFHAVGGIESLNHALDRADATLSGWLAAHPHEQVRAGAVANEVGAVRLQVQTHELTRRRESVDALQSALRRMRTAGSVEALTAQVPREVSALGFRRVLFSWVDQARWVPVSTYTASGPEEARAIMAAGDAPYWHTRDLLEAAMIRHRRSMLVRDALDNPHVHLDIQAVMHSTSYVAAPLIRGSKVVGFVHADQSVEGAELDGFDRDLISMFVEGLGLAFERVAMREELDSVRSRLGRQASALSDLVAQIGDIDATEPRTSAVEEPRGEVAFPASSESVPLRLGEGLTRREAQVYALLGDGVSNAEIADRLYIAEGTVKTHVKHVLRKVSAENRAHAGALYRSRPRREPGWTEG